jgi:hypothetical protein
MNTQQHFDLFVQFVQAVSNAYMDESFPRLPKPKIEVEEGSVYWRVVRVDNQRSVYCFVRKVDGAIFKAATWKSPALKPGLRGYINDYPNELLGAYGIAYLTGSNIRPRNYPPRPVSAELIA